MLMMQPSMAFNYTQEPVMHVAQIGISIEPLGNVQQMVPSTQTTASNASNFTEFINKTINNLYNYCSSFSRSTKELIDQQNPLHAHLGVSNDTQYVPLNSLKDWYDNYTRRLNNDQNFWKTLS